MKRSGRFWFLLYLCCALAATARAELHPPAIAVPTSVVRAAKGKCYHRPGCRAARGSLAVITPAEAIADGLKACQRCLDRGAAKRKKAAPAGGLDALPPLPPIAVESAPPRAPAPVESASPSPRPSAAPAPIVGAQKMPWDDESALIHR